MCGPSRFRKYGDTRVLSTLKNKVPAVKLNEKTSAVRSFANNYFQTIEEYLQHQLIDVGLIDVGDGMTNGLMGYMQFRISSFNSHIFFSNIPTFQL